MQLDPETVQFAWKVGSAAVLIAFTAGAYVIGAKQQRKDINGIGKKLNQVERCLMLMARNQAEKEKIIGLLSK